ncbi:MAG: hypothetical protein PVI86_14750 [Phycisphaerae bacterium]|jgi:hypothetical protein
MKVFDAFSEGTARIWLHKRVLFWLYVINVLFAAVLVVPFRRLAGELAKTDLADDFVSHFPLETGLEFWHHHASAFKGLGTSAVALGVLYLLLSVFLTGGIVAALTVGHRVSLRRFFHDAAKYFWRYLRLLILLVAVLGAVAGAFAALASDYIEEAREASVTDRESFLWRAGSILVVLAVTSLVLMVFDYAKIRAVVDRRRSMFGALLVSFGFCLRRFWHTIPLYLLNLLIVGLIFGVYVVVAGLFSKTTLVSMITLLVIQQFFVFARIWMRMSFFATQWAYYDWVRTRPLRPPASPVTPAPRVPAPATC